MVQDNVRLQVVASVGAVFTIGAGESSWTTLVMSVHVSHKVCFSQEGTGAEGALVVEVREERRYDSGVITAVTLFAKGSVFKRVAPGGVIVFPMGVELVEFMRGKWGDAEEGSEEDF